MTNEGGEIRDINEAWRCRKYDIVLTLLEEDAEYPDSFNIVDPGEGTEDQKRLFQFVEQRLSLHDLIKKGDFQKLQAFPFDRKSKLFLNTKNESAAFTAIKNKQFQIFAYLNSLGLKFKNTSEQEILRLMDNAGKNAVTDSLVNFFKPVPAAHIYYLISKSRSQPPKDNLEEIVKNYYQKLEKLPEILIILKIIQYADFLDIIFDFDNDNVTPLAPSTDISTRGETRYKEGRIYIAAGCARTEKHILGTIAHELTHMAMEILYKNKCNPYTENEEFKFEKIREHCQNLTANNDALSRTLLDVFSYYNKEDYDSELIVRVPQIIAQFNNGKMWLKIYASTLLDYYTETVIHDCKKFLKQSHNLKAKSQIQRINESIGEIQRVKKSDLFFKDVSKIRSFFEKETNRLTLFVGNNTWLSVLRVLQALYEEDYIKKSDNYLVIKFSAYMREPHMIIREFYLAGCDVLILENIKNFEDFSKSDGKMCLENLLSERAHKRIIFTTSNDKSSMVNKTLEVSKLQYSCYTDKPVRFSDLDIKSQRMILEKEIIFRESKIRVADLMKNDDKVKKLIDANTIEDLIKDEHLEIGTKALGMANLEGAYGDLLQEINFESLIKELEYSNDIFLFDGLEEPRKIDQLISILTGNNSKTDEGNVTLKRIRKGLSDTSRVFFVNKFSEKKFKEFCQLHPQEEIYWIKINDSTLTLQQLYNFNFYLNRKFVFYDKLYVKKESLINISNDFFFPEMLLISNATRESFIGLYDCPNIETKQKYEKILERMRPLFIPEKNAIASFKTFVSSNTTIHWLKKEEEKLIWKNSYGPLKDIRQCIDKNISHKTSITEKDLVKRVINREVVIIADDPGMGKTTTLTKLYDTDYDSKTIIDTHWVMRINFKDHLPAIKNIDIDNINIQEMVKFFSETNPNLKSNLAKNLLTYILRAKFDFFKPLLLSFDGFDELLDESDRKKIIASLKFLKEKTKSKIWITTRLHYKELLENNLSSFAIEFEPIDDKGKEEFIKKYLKNRMKLIVNPDRFKEIFIKGNEGSKPQIIESTKKFLTKIENLFANDITRFIGTPLQLYLMLEGILEHLKPENQNQLDFSYLGNNIMEVYKNFINKKYGIYFKKFKNDVLIFNLKQIKAVYNMYHKQLAKILILNSTSKKSLEKLQNIILSCGIIKYQEGSLEFIHQTFGEYFAAKIISNWIKKDKKYTLCSKKIKHVLEEILLKPDYKLVRIFLNFKINEMNTEMLPHENLIKFGKTMAYLLNNKEDSNKTFMDVIIQEEHFRILDFAITAIRHVEEDFLKFKSHLGDPILIYACRCNSSEVVKYLLDKMTILTIQKQYSLLCERGINNETCLHHAALYNNVDIVKLLIDKGKRVKSTNQLQDLLTIKDENNNTVLHLAASFIGKLYADYDEKIAEIPEYKKNLAYLKPEKYCSPEKPYETLSSNMYKNIDRHSTSLQSQKYVAQDLKDSKDLYKTASSDIFKLLTDLELSPTALYDLLCASNNENLTALHLACLNGDYSLVKFILDKAKEIINKKNLIRSKNNAGLQLNLNAEICKLILSKDCNERNSLHMAATFNHSKITLLLMNKIQFNKKYDVVRTTDVLGSTVMHQVASKGHCGPVINIFNELDKIRTTYQQIKNLLLLKNLEGKTALHIAAEKGHIQLLKTFIDNAVKLAAQNPHELITEQASNGASVLHTAVSSGQIEVTKFLLDMIPKVMLFAKLSLQDKNSNNVLHTAARQENCEMVELIIKKLEKELFKEQMNHFFFLKTKDNEDVVNLGVRNSNLAVTKFLVKYASDISQQNIYDLITRTSAHKTEVSVIHRAMEYGTLEVAKFLLDKIPQDKVYTTLSLANYEQEYTVLHMAAFQESPDFIKLIIKKVEDSLTEELIRQLFLLRNKLGDDIFHLAARHSNLDVMKYLLEYGAKILHQDKCNLIIPKKMNDNSVIHRAVRFGRIEVVEFLLNMIPKEKVYDTFSLTSSTGNNIFHMAIYQDDKEIVELVLKKLEEALTKDEIRQFFFLKTSTGNNNVLHIAAKKSNLTVMEYLLNYAKKISKIDESKYDFIITKGFNEGNVIHKAVGSGRIAIAKFLLDLIPKEEVYHVLTQADKNGNTILHMLANQENCNFTELFTKNFFEDASLSSEQVHEFLYLQNSEGNTAISIARKENNSAAEKLLTDIEDLSHNLTRESTTKKAKKNRSSFFKYANPVNLKRKFFS